MSTPVTASWRFEFPIVVDGFIHRNHCYVKAQPSTLHPPYDLVMNHSGVNITMQAAVDSYLTLWKASYSVASTTFGAVLLQQLSGGAWLPVATITPTVAPTGAVPYVPASQMTVTARDSAFHKIKVVQLETVDGAGTKYLPPSTGGSATVFAWYTDSSGSAPTDGSQWIVGRSNLYVTSCVSLVTDLNDKIRRRRGIV